MSHFIAVQCLECGASFQKRDTEIKRSPKHFCSRSCSGRYNSRGRKLSEQTKVRISKSLQGKPRTTSKEEAIANGISSQKGKRVVPNSIALVSSRTASKILQRMNIGCSNCGWSESTCDIHHIKGRKIPDPHNHDNLSYLCPNCHRLAHNGKIKTLKTLTEQLQQEGKNWQEYYYG